MPFARSGGVCRRGHFGGACVRACMRASPSCRPDRSAFFLPGVSQSVNLREFHILAQFLKMLDGIFKMSGGRFNMSGGRFKCPAVGGEKYLMQLKRTLCNQTELIATHNTFFKDTYCNPPNNLLQTTYCVTLDVTS